MFVKLCKFLPGFVKTIDKSYKNENSCRMLSTLKRVRACVRVFGVAVQVYDPAQMQRSRRFLASRRDARSVSRDGQMTTLIYIYIYIDMFICI